MGVLLREHKIGVSSITISGSAVSANSTSEQTFTVTGLRPGDFVETLKPSHQTGLGVVNCRVSANDTLAITFMNNTAGAITPTNETYTLLVVRPEITQSGVFNP
jgi:hypothetical protein